jgi:hypothetical protein
MSVLVDTGVLLGAIDADDADHQPAVELIRRYADMNLGLVDASIVAIAERMDVTTVATLNRRDFAVVRPAHIGAFELTP